MNFTVSDILNLLTDEEAKMAMSKYYGNIAVALENQENTSEVFRSLSQNGLTFTSASDIRILTMKAEALNAAIDLWKNAGRIHLIENSISYLRYKADVILSRIMLCESVGKKYTDETNKVLSFILNDDEWLEVKKGLNADSAIEFPLNSNEENLAFAKSEKEIATFENFFGETFVRIQEALISPEAELTDVNFDRYTTLVNAFHNIVASLGYTPNIELAEFYIKNLITYSDLSDIDVIRAAIIGSDYITLEDLYSIDDIIREFVGSRRV